MIKMIFQMRIYKGDYTDRNFIRGLSRFLAGSTVNLSNLGKIGFSTVVVNRCIKRILFIHTIATTTNSI